jgi:hypothetical protein
LDDWPQQVILFSFEHQIPVAPDENKINGNSDNGQVKYGVSDYGKKHGGSFK